MGDDARRGEVVKPEVAQHAFTATSYAIAVPAQWAHIPLGDPDEMLAHASGSIPASDDDHWRAEMGALFTEVVTADSNRSLLDAYITVGPVPGTAVSASLTVARADLAHAPQRTSTDYLLARAVTDGAEVIDVAGAVGVLTPRDPAETDSSTPSRVVRAENAFIQVPGRDDFLLICSFNAVTNEPPIAALADAEQHIGASLSELFRALLSTVRWVDECGDIRSPRAGGAQ